MMQDTGDSAGPRQFGAARRDVVINRPYRRRITGVAYTAQRSRLVLDMPDAAGNDSYPCKIADVSVGGFGVVCQAAQQAMDVFQSGALMTLEAWDGMRARVEVRWANNDRLGLKRSASASQ
jgi:hypothetical protein